LKRIAAAALAAVVLGACFGSGTGETQSGLGLPQVAVDFPPVSRAGSRQVARLRVSNPGPGRMSSIIVAFSRTGPSPGATALPPPVVDLGFDRSNASILAIRPRPDGVSPDGVVYRFGPLGVGDSTTISFTLRVPKITGVAANAVVVYDGAHTDRAQGVRLQTVVGP
jgi:hypothetical protein